MVLGNLLIFADEKCNNVTKKVCWHGDKKRKISETAYRKEEMPQGQVSDI